MDKHLWIQGQPGLHNKFKIRQGYILRPALNNREREKEKIMAVGDFCKVNFIFFFRETGNYK